jgi:predicted nucleic acid-binding Zn ribbon protein
VKRHGRQTGLGQALDGVLRRLDRKNGGAYASARAASAWADIAGPLVVAHTTGAHLRDGTLVVFVDGPIWATELAAMAEHYRTSVNTAIGEDLVSAVRFTVSRRVVKEHNLER